MGAEKQGLPRLSVLPDPAADLRGFLSTTHVLGVNREWVAALASGLTLEERIAL